VTLRREGDDEDVRRGPRGCRRRRHRRWRGREVSVGRRPRRLRLGGILAELEFCCAWR
jgi:hypothetical protein